MAKPKRGRPTTGDAEKRKTEQNRKIQKDRLRDALQRLGLSQAEVARRSGIPQGTVNHFLNTTKRDIKLHDLRKLASAGIPPDFLVGLADELIPPGQSRPPASLEDDLADSVWAVAKRKPLEVAVRAESVRRGDTELTLDLIGLKAPLFIRRDQLVKALAEQVRKELEQWVEYHEVINMIMMAYDFDSVLGGLHIHDAEDQMALSEANRRVSRLVDFVLPPEPETQLVSDPKESFEMRARRVASPRTAQPRTRPGRKS